jgi:Ca2+-transporting ATPase
VFNMRGQTQSHRSNLLHNEVTRNPYVWGALALCIALLMAAVYIPGLAQILDVSDPGLQGWALVIAMSLIPLLGGQILKWKEVL